MLGLALCAILLAIHPAQAAERDGRLLDRLLQKTEQVPAGQDIQRDLVYASVDGRDLHLDLWLPGSKGPHPVLVYIHGGAWTGGRKEQGAELLSAAAQHGYLAATVEYRLAGEAMWPAQIEDCRAALEWIGAHCTDYGGDPEQIVVTGGSAGAHLALLLACGWGVDGGGRSGGVWTEEAWPGRNIRACCSWFGPTDMRQLADLPRASKNIEQFLGSQQDERASNGAEASPILYVDRKDPPVLFIHGTDDPLVPIRQSEKMRDALAAVGVTSQLITVEGGSHGIKIGDKATREKLAQQMLEWFDRELAKH